MLLSMLFTLGALAQSGPPVLTSQEEQALLFGVLGPIALATDSEPAEPGEYAVAGVLGGLSLAIGMPIGIGEHKAAQAALRELDAQAPTPR